MNPEFELVLACLRWPQEAAGGDRIRSLASRPIRWPYLLEILEHHKVVPLFYRNLQSFAIDCVPEGAAAALRAEVMANADICRQRRTEIALLNRRLSEQQINFRVFKGIPLAIAAFQDESLRDAGDIDLLIAQKDIGKTGEILEAEGYRRTEPRAQLTPRRLRSYLAHQKDFSYEHSCGTVLDLHWRLFRNIFLPANAGLAETGENWLELGTGRIATLPPHRLLLYLCVHGTLDGWLRLKWLADIGALLHTMTAEELGRTAALAAEQQALPELSAAILLCHDLLGSTVVFTGCLDRSDAQVERILAFSKGLMMSNQCRPIREQTSSTQWFLNEWRLHNGARYRLDLVERSLFRARVWEKVNLPDALFPLYALISPFERLLFHLRSRLRLRQITAADIGLAIEAGCMLTFFRIALNFLPVQKLTRWMSRPQKTSALISEQKEAQILRRVEWSIGAVVRHFPVRFMCFPQSLTAYFMLRRRHISSQLFYGIARDANQLKAHTWIKVGDRIVVGGDAASSFTVLATFP
jgi:Uncharacterised nucleotidyltransferase/Transglutaminase-like superfamily